MRTERSVERVGIKDRLRSRLRLNNPVYQYTNTPMNDSPLTEIICRKIKEQGMMSFRDFMELALYHPDHGYYMSSDERIGPEGDFYTSPHLHQIFGEVIGLQVLEMLRHLEEEGPFALVEVGGGRGYLAEGVLETLQRRGIELEWTYFLIERNRAVMNRQKKILERFGSRVKWAGSLEALGSFRGVILSNELLDAFPVHLIEYREGFREVYLACEEDGFREVLLPVENPQLLDYIDKYDIPRIEGYRTEVNLELREFLRLVSRVMEEGFMMSIDYGYPAWEYYAPERNRGTLLSYYRHQVVEDPSLNPGKQDITTHVNFTALRDWGEEAGFRLVGYAPQGTFLISSGLDRLVSERLERDKDFQRDLPKIKGLILGMGDTHKVMVQYRGAGPLPELSGFALRNRMSRL